MLAQIEERFRGNLDRVRNVVKLYVSVTGQAAGRPSVQESDLLRAAVVLLHASLEDVLRGLAELRLPQSAAEILALIPLDGFGNNRKTNFTLGNLAAFRGNTVDEVISRSVVAMLERKHYDDLGDVKRQLQEISINPGLADQFATSLSALISRRHQIAHRADRNDSGGSGQHQARSISRATVDSWIRSVEMFGRALLESV